MSAPFTPPPWPIKRGGFGALVVGPAVLMHPGNERVEFALERGHDLLAQRDADASLIAAAPQMLAALKRIKIVMDGIVHPGCRSPDDSLSEVEAAIAKAEGGAA